MSDADVIVIGAGIVGIACARACSLAGFRVIVVEQAESGSGATGAAMGHLVVLNDSPAQWALSHYGRELWRAMQHDLPTSAEYREPGTLWVAENAEELAGAEARARFLEGEGEPAQMLTPRDLQAEEPHLNPRLAGALLVRSDAVLAPVAAAAFLLDEAKRRGARVIREKVVVASHGEVVCSDGSHLRARTIVLATGAFAELLPDASLVRKRKGHLLLTARYPGLIRHQVVELGYMKSAHGGDEHSVAANLQPRSNGQILIGSSRQFGDESAEIDPSIMERMLTRAAAYLPAVLNLVTARAWIGFRAATPDNLPLIGPAAAFDGDDSLWLATGHEGLGITTSLATGELLVNHLLGRRPEVDPGPYLPARMVARRAMGDMQ